MLKISPSDFARLRALCERAYPHEACGILLGDVQDDVREVRAVVSCGNERADSPQTRYQIAPMELIAAQKQARAAKLEIIGFYHSHPEHPAQWSATDLAEAHWLGCVYVITSVQSGVAAATNAFALRGANEENKYFEKEQLEIADSLSQ